MLHVVWDSTHTQMTPKHHAAQGESTALTFGWCAKAKKSIVLVYNTF